MRRALTIPPESRAGRGSPASRLLVALGLVLATALVPGCGTGLTPFPVEMSLHATNTADHILVVEGQTNLPAGSPLKAELLTREGQVLLRDSSVVSHARFFFDFDLTRLDGLEMCQVKVRFDPQAAPLGVRQVTGLWGEALRGSGVQTTSQRRLLERQLEVILVPGGQGEDWEGRDFEALDVSERVRLTAQIEKRLEQHPEDRHARLALARAYIASDPRELASGTRAHALLRQVAEGSAEDALGLQASKILEGVAAEEKEAQAKMARREKVTRGDRFREEKTILPGRAVGAFRLGTSFRLLQRHLKVKEPPEVTADSDGLLLKPSEFPGLELTFASATYRLRSIRTTSERFKLPEGFGVGNLLQELQEAYGKEAVPTPDFRFQETRADGTRVYRGRTVASGLEFEIVRTVDPVFGLPLDKVEAISVFSEP